MIKTIKAFIWFTINSSRYMEGQRVKMLVGFWPAWRVFHELEKINR